MLIATSAAAQEARIEGVVFDSLRMRPLARAAVWSATSARATISDSKGRFTLDSLPAGRHLLLAADQALDSLGLQISGIATATATSPSATLLTSPSIRTLARRLCAAGDSLPPRTGILFGSVRSAASRELVPGALVNITWLSVQHVGDRYRPELAAAHPLTDSLGTYAVCGIPVDTSLQVAAHGGPRGSSGWAYLTIGELRVLRADFYLATSDNAKGVVRGTVSDSAGRRLAAVNVAIDGAAVETRTNPNGEFHLREAPAGTRTLVVRRPGFAPVYTTTTVTPADTQFVQVSMANIRLLTTVEVRAERTSRAMEQIAQRQKTGFGYHRTSDELRDAPSLVAVLRTTPGVRVESGRMAGDYFYFGPGRSIGGGDCLLSVFLDGVRTGPEMLYLLDVQELLAVEVYPRGEQVPAEFQSRTNGCGAIMIWTGMMG